MHKMIDMFLYAVLVAAAILATLGFCVALLAGCAAPQPTYAVNFDASFSDADKATIEAGFAEWPVVAHGDINVVLGTDPRCPLQSAADPGKHFDGFATGHTVCFYMDRIDTKLQQIAAHEYGHVLGLRFNGDEHYRGTEPSIMTPSTEGQAATPQAVDLAAL